jgi:hypothetical protein
MMNRAFVIAAFLAVVVASSSGAHAASVSLVAHLLGSGEVPATESDAFAEGQFTYDSDSHALQYYVNYDGVAPAKVDIHGPASAKSKADAVLTIPVSDSPLGGTITLTPDQGDALLAGKMYIDIHSQKYPDGEIRGQIVKQ